MSDNKETNRNRATMAPGGCECSKCGCIFIGGETHTECGICANATKQDWAPARIWLQRGVGDDGSHTWCSDSQDEHEQAEYVRVDVQAPAVEARARDERAHAWNDYRRECLSLRDELPDVADFFAGWDAALARASEAAAGEPVAVTTAEFETAIETLRHVIDCLRERGSYTDEEGEATDFLAPLLHARLAAPQPASEQQESAIDLAAALEQQRALAIVVALRAQGFSKSNSDLPTQAESVFDLACEEIEHRLRTEVWTLNGTATPLPGEQQASRVGTAEISGGRVRSYTFEQTDTPDGTYSLYTAGHQAARGLSDDARECLMDVVSHHANIVAGFAAQREAAHDANDGDNALYWKREIDVAHRMKAQAERALLAAKGDGHA